MKYSLIYLDKCCAKTTIIWVRVTQRMDPSMTQARADIKDATDYVSARKGNRAV